MPDQIPETLDPGVIFEHAHYPPDELNAEVISLAGSLGWRGRDAGDADLIRSVVVAAGHGDPEPDIDLPPPDTPDGFDPTNELAVNENLTWAADDAEAWLNDHFAPHGCWIGNDGEAGAFGVWHEDEED